MPAELTPDGFHGAQGDGVVEAFIADGAHRVQAAALQMAVGGVSISIRNGAGSVTATAGVDIQFGKKSGCPGREPSRPCDRTGRVCFLHGG